MRYRFDVAAVSVADVVCFAGGWIFDRVMAGWDVTVLIDTDEDRRPVHILGADTMDLETALGTWAGRAHPHSVAVSTQLIGSDARIRDGVLKALDHGATEVTLWGEVWPSGLTRTVDCVEHRLSAAARAFKAQALAALGIPALDAESIETFRSGTANCLSIAADLVPAS
ncbi:MAG TPA: hypothetical protein VFB19_05695 [Mycobacterium sp.]|nr:hypothetical protein [Mycobacterium sp.]